MEPALCGALAHKVVDCASLWEAGDYKQVVTIVVSLEVSQFFCQIWQQEIWTGKLSAWGECVCSFGPGREVAVFSDPRGGHLNLEEAVLILGCFSSSHPWGRKVDTRDTLQRQGEMAGSATHPSLPAKRSASAHPAKPTPHPASLHKRMPKT